MVRNICLEDHLARRSSPSSTPGNLGQQLKRALRRAKIGEAQCEIGTDHPHESHPVDVMTLGDHLCAGEQVKLPCVKSAEHPLEISAITHRVAVEPANTYRGKRTVEQVFKLLGSRTEEVYVLAGALRTDRRDRLLMPAVVADHAVRAPVMRKRDRIILALQRLAATATQHYRRVPAPVQQDHRLLPTFEPLANLAAQLS